MEDSDKKIKAPEKQKPLLDEIYNIYQLNGEIKYL